MNRAMFLRMVEAATVVKDIQQRREIAAAVIEYAHSIKFDIHTSDFTHAVAHKQVFGLVGEYLHWMYEGAASTKRPKWIK